MVSGCRCLLVVAGLLTPCLGYTQPAVNEDLLGLTAQALQDAFPSALKRKAKPSKGPHGETGLFFLSQADLAGQRVEATFYFKNRQIQRIEQHWTAADAQCQQAYATLVHDLEAKYGTGIHSDDQDYTATQNQSSAWVADKFKVMAYKIPLQHRCDLLLAFESHQEIDASNL